jgi:alkylation response protein AidB-like acyl-CoA dehydrogenase
VSNPLLSDREVDFVLYQVHRVERLCRLPAFADHTRETFDLVLQSYRRVARDLLFPAYRPMDAEPPVLRDGAVTVHPRMKTIYPRLVELGVVAAARPYEVGGQRLPLAVVTAANGYLMAANAAAYGYLGLTTGAAHLLEAFGDEWVRRELMAPMYRGEWTGTMALTEPQAGSSLADVQTAAAPRGDGTYAIRGSKIFISGGDHDLTDNIVHMTLARITGAPAGIKGVSLFAVPKRRPEGDRLVDNDVAAAGVIHKIGWRGLPSLVMSYGERDDCRGWLVGEPHRGISYMFQMMNEARLMVGLNAVATASVAYHESVAYARGRAQGRPLGARSPAEPQVPIIEHADVRRMLLRQKAIVEGGLSLLVATSCLADVAEHAETAAERERAGLLVDLLTPVAKSFPAERGYEANALAVQVHGGYGYSSEYLPEAWLRDQKLNSIHEGTTGVQSLDLLGRKAVAGGGAAMRAFAEVTATTVARARDAGVDPTWCDALARAVALTGEVTAALGALGLAGDVEAMMRHSADYLDLFATVAIAWQWLEQAAATHEAEVDGDGFYAGKRCAAQYWLATELPRVEHLARLCRDREDSYARMRPAWF